MTGDGSAAGNQRAAAPASDDANEQEVVAMNKDGSFAGKVAFVTGAASGIGRAAALASRTRALASSSPTSPRRPTRKRPA